MSQPTHILFADLETTDTDPYAPHAAVLEIGIIITRHDPELTEVGRASVVVRPPGLMSDHDMIWSRMHPVVQQMHRDNGLWQEATTDGANLVDADSQLADWIARVVTNDGGDLPLPVGGSGVGHLDLPFVKVHLPAIARRLTYWPLDIGNVRRLLDVAGRADLVDLATDVDAKPHRGLADVELHVAEARRYLQLLAAIPVAEAALTTPLGEDVTDATLGHVALPHADGRQCGFHHRLGVWVTADAEGRLTRRCARDHDLISGAPLLAGS